MTNIKPDYGSFSLCRWVTETPKKKKNGGSASKHFECHTVYKGTLCHCYRCTIIFSILDWDMISNQPAIGFEGLIIIHMEILNQR